ncbi:MAG: hypothetical protein Q9187_006285, partial [Circinaria calcarea]
MATTNLGEKNTSDIGAVNVPVKDTADSPPPVNLNLLTWDSPDDPENPKNWPTSKRWVATLIVSSFTFFTPLSSTMISPSTAAIASDLGINSPAEVEIILSVFLLGLGFGPLVLGPVSEMNGRVPVLQIGNLFYLVWSVACGFARTKGQLTAFRFLSGLGASAPTAIGGGLISDLWKPEERGKVIAIYTAGPLLGPAIGPIIGGYITQYTVWRWVFWAVSIGDALLQVIAIFLLKETYTPKILARKAQRLQRKNGGSKYKTEFDDPDKTLVKLIRTNLIRPLRMIGTQAIMQLLALYMAILYGIMFLLLFTFPLLWTNRYHQSVGSGTLNYISIAIGFILGSQINGPLNDLIYTRLKKRNHGLGLPEFRIPLMVPGSLAVPLGLFWYGWTAQLHTHWILPNIGAAIFCCGVIICFQNIQTYTIDAYTRYAASALSTLNVTRCLAGFGFPLFAPHMYSSLGYGWGNSVLGFVALGVGAVMPVVLW